MRLVGEEVRAGCVCGGLGSSFKGHLQEEEAPFSSDHPPPSLPSSDSGPALSHGAKDTCPHPKPGMWTELQSVD